MTFSYDVCHVYNVREIFFNGDFCSTRKCADTLYSKSSCLLIYGFRKYIFQGYVFEKKSKREVVRTSMSKYSTAEIKDRWHPRRRERSIISASLEKRRTVAYPLIPARSYALGNPRGSPWRHFVGRLGALRERNTGSYHAKRVPWCELRGTGRKRDKRKNKRKSGIKREREKERKEGEGTCGGRRKGETGGRGRWRKGEISEGGTKTTGIQGEPASFLRDVLTLERTALRPLSPPPSPGRQPRRGAGGPNSGEKAERGVSSGGGEQERADSRGRETFQSLVASLLVPGLLACSPRSLVCSPLAKSPS